MKVEISVSEIVEVFKEIQEQPGKIYNGNMTIPLDPLATTVTGYMNHDINLTANFAGK